MKGNGSVNTFKSFIYWLSNYLTKEMKAWLHWTRIEFVNHFNFTLLVGCGAISPPLRRLSRTLMNVIWNLLSFITLRLSLISPEHLYCLVNCSYCNRICWPPITISGRHQFCQEEKKQRKFVQIGPESWVAEALITKTLKVQRMCKLICCFKLNWFFVSFL